MHRFPSVKKVVRDDGDANVDVEKANTTRPPCRRARRKKENLRVEPDEDAEDAVDTELGVEGGRDI